ncbi:MAG: 50S ribosomal protein L19e [Candidatus Micrarchaeia archaeon]|jgi:large subunit ribosomal protein L19e
MSIKTIRRIASELLHSGENKVKIKPDETSKVKEALTRDDVRALIKDGIVYKTKKQGVSRAGAKARQKQKKKGRQKGIGKRKGRVKKMPKKQWMAKSRIQREILSYLSKNNLIESDARKNMYYKIKGGFFKNKNSLIHYINDNSLTKEKIDLLELTKKIKEGRPKVIKIKKKTKEEKAIEKKEQKVNEKK